MKDEGKFKQLSKRKFLKMSALGAGYLGLGLSGMRLFGHSKTSRVKAQAGQGIWKWSKEALFYISTPRGLKCQLCPQACVLKEGETGDCKTNVNFGNKLYSITYGNPCAVHIDPIEKKPLYHFLPGTQSYSIATAGCNLACLNCQNWQISQSSPKETRNYDLMPSKLVKQALQYGCKSIAYTYSDPVAFYEYTLDASKIARQSAIKNIIVSAGYINPKPLKEWCKYIDAANIDLKSFSNEIYEMLNAGTLQPVLDSLKILKEEGTWLEITNLIVPTWTDDFEMIRKMCDWLYDNGFEDNPLHFSRFHPMYQLTNLPATPLSSLDKARKTAKEAGIKHVYIGNVPGSQYENTYCPQCNQLIVERKGYRILQKHIQNNKCTYCGQSIPGVWE